RKRDPEQERLGRGADGREVRQVHPGRTPPEPLRILAREEVHLLDEQVGRRGEEPGGTVDQSRVVAGPPEDRSGGRKQRAQSFDHAVLGLHARCVGDAGARRRPPDAVTGISRAGGSDGTFEGFPPSPTPASAGSSAMSSTSCIDSTYRKVMS